MGKTVVFFIEEQVRYICRTGGDIEEFIAKSDESYRPSRKKGDSYDPGNRRQ